MSTPLFDNARPPVEDAAALDKETDDPRLLPTTDAAAEPPPSELPWRIVGEYEVLAPLGSGGMGEVYKARHRRLNKFVALKLLPADSREPREAAARFQREMKAVGDLDHPNVVEAHDAGEQSGVVYLAMKLIDGVDLERLVKQRGPLPIAEACELVRQAALGLHYLHERGLVHRDVKPSNLMRTPDGTVKVLDLGLARWCIDEVEVRHSLTGMGRLMGTPDFLAPEQVENAADADARADLYGLGGTLFYLLIGRAPFADHKSQFSKVEAQRSEPPPDVRTLRPEVPAELAALLNRLLAKKPEERLATAAEVAEALAANVAASVPLAGSLPNDPVAAKPPRAKPRWPWLVAAAATMTLTALLMFLSLSHSEQRPSSTPQQGQENPPEPVHIVTLDVMLTRNVNGGGLPVGRIGERVFDPQLGDHVTVDARLSRLAYAFLIAFRPDGQAELCFPEKEDEPPSLTDNPRYPSTPESVGKEYELTDGEGLQAFALVVSSQRLPAYTEWRPQCRGCPWKKEEAPPHMVYRANGEDPVEVLAGDGSRGKGGRVKGKTPVAELAAWLRKMPGVETVQVLGFVVLPQEKR
ncbi:MAG TPA: serine/threonine-protein kinase [Gemmataceae bacterium]|nr:serine/threonine-protein kinase [Gemmataceae bacterium]